MGAVLRAARAASSLLLARAEFAAVELTQTGADALRWLLGALCATALLVLTFLAATAAIVLALWDWLGWTSLGVLALAYGIAAAWLIARLLRALRTRRPLLSHTLAELEKDREAVFGRSAGEHSEPKP